MLYRLYALLSASYLCLVVDSSFLIHHCNWVCQTLLQFRNVLFDSFNDEPNLFEFLVEEVDLLVVAFGGGGRKDVSDVD